MRPIARPRAPLVALLLGTVALPVACDYVPDFARPNESEAHARRRHRGTGTDREPAPARTRSHPHDRARDVPSERTGDTVRDEPAAPPAALPPGAVARLRITFIDVGQGDGALLESADGHAAMIDTGPPDGRARVRETLASHHVTHLDWLMVSHPHADHIGNARDVLTDVTVDRVIDPAYPSATTTYDRFLALVQSRNIPFTVARPGLHFALGPVVDVELLAPREPFVSDSRSNANANSIVARVTVGTVHVLFTGDAERETEARLLTEHRDHLAADVLKVAHHGSRYASSDEFLAAVSPRFAVISCATGNDYGHPHAGTLAALAGHHTTLYRTDVNGDVAFATDGTQIAFATARTATVEQLAAPGTHGSE